MVRKKNFTEKIVIVGGREMLSAEQYTKQTHLRKKTGNHQPLLLECCYYNTAIKSDPASNRYREKIFLIYNTHVDSHTRLWVGVNVIGWTLLCVVRSDDPQASFQITSQVVSQIFDFTLLSRTIRFDFHEQWLCSITLQEHYLVLSIVYYTNPFLWINVVFYLVFKNLPTVYKKVKSPRELEPFFLLSILYKQLLFFILFHF